MRVRVTRVTPSFFRLLRVAPALGRTFTDEEGEIGNEKKVVLSYALWQSQFGGDPSVVGKDIRLDGQPYTIVGVMPQGLLLPEPDGDAVAAARLHAAAEERRAAAQQQLPEHRAAEAGRDASQQAQQQIDALNAAQPRALPAVQAAADQRRLPHHGRSAAGHAGARRQADALPDVGRRAVRAADRLRQRREPGAGALARRG